MGCRGGLFYKDIDKVQTHPKRGLQQRCLSRRLSKTQAAFVQALFAKQLLLSWTARSRTKNLSISVVRHEYTHVEGSQSVECTLVLPRVELRDEVSLIVVFSNETLAILGWIRRPSLRTNLDTRRKVASCCRMGSLPRTCRYSNSSADHSKASWRRPNSVP
jgi:hypothetical protein